EARPRPETVELLWHDPGTILRARRHASFREILDTAPGCSIDEVDLPPQERATMVDRRAVAALLAQGEPTGADDLWDTIAAAVDADGVFEAPLVLLAGDLEFPFDEVAQLRATVAAVQPALAVNPKLAEVVGEVGGLLGTPWLAGASSVVETL